MARPRKFNEERVIERAMHLFWRNGFEATSLSDLLRVTGLSKSSLYGSFGDKRSLFMASLDAYRQQRRARLRAVLAGGPTARDAIESFLRGIIRDAANPDGAYGCMICNEAVEFGASDEEMHRIVLDDFNEIEDAFAATIVLGQQDGSIASTSEPRKLARFLTTTMQGLQVMIRAQAEPARLQDTIDITINALDTGHSRQPQG